MSTDVQATSSSHVMGYGVLVRALAANIDSLQDLGIAYLALTAVLNKLNQDISLAWLEIISLGPDSDEKKISEAMKLPSGTDEELKTKQAKLTELTSIYKQHGTVSSQMQSFIMGLVEASQRIGESSNESTKELIAGGNSIITVMRSFTNTFSA